MYEKVSLTKTPLTARRLIEYSRFSNLELPESIYKLAVKDKFQQTDFLDLTKIPTQTEINIMQFINDRYGRAIIVDGKLNAAYPTLLYAKVKNLFPLLIIADQTFHDYWKGILAQIMPDKAVLSAKANFKNFETELKDNQYDVYLLSYSLITEAFKTVKFRHVIFPNFKDTVSHESRATLYHLLKEVYSSTLIVNVRSLVDKFSSNIYTKSDQELWESIKWDNQGANRLLLIFSEILNKTANYHSLLFNNGYSRVFEILKEKGYTDFTNPKLFLPIININAELMEDSISDK